MKILFCDNSLRELVNFREKVFDDFAEKGHDIVLLAPKNRDYVPKYGNAFGITGTGTRPGAGIIR